MVLAWLKCELAFVIKQSMVLQLASGQPLKANMTSLRNYSRILFRLDHAEKNKTQSDYQGSAGFDIRLSTQAPKSRLRTRPSPASSARR